MATLKANDIYNTSALYRSRSVPENISGEHATKQSFNVIKDFLSNIGNWRANKHKKIKKPENKRSITIDGGEEFNVQDVKRVKDTHKRLEGGGHVFVPHSVHYITWCDLCGETIWGFVKRGVRCRSK